MEILRSVSSAWWFWTCVLIAGLWGACLYMSKKKGRARSGALDRAILWLPLAFLIVAFAGVSQSVNSVQTEHERIALGDHSHDHSEHADSGKATMEPGRVVSLDTSKGRIEFVLFEQDCPESTARIIEFAEKGYYDGVKFDRVEKNALIQIAEPDKNAAPICREVREGLINARGAVGMARTNNPDSATSVFYVLLEPWRHLDMEYTVFGRLISGMDVARKISIGDTIRKAKVRKLTGADRKRFDRVMQIEAEQNTQ